MKTQVLYLLKKIHVSADQSSSNTSSSRVNCSVVDVSQQSTNGFWQGRLLLLVRTTSAPSHPLPSMLPNAVTTESASHTSQSLPGVALASWSTAELEHGAQWTKPTAQATPGRPLGPESSPAPPTAVYIIHLWLRSRMMVPQVLPSRKQQQPSPTNLLEMHILRLHARSTASETGIGPSDQGV